MVTVASRRGTAGVDTHDSRLTAEQVDLIDPASVRELFTRIGRFDHLVLSAGPGAVGTVHDLPSTAARPYLDTKFWGYYEAVPNDVAGAALFLMTNTWITGTVLDIDGGVQIS